MANYSLAIFVAVLTPALLLARPSHQRLPESASAITIDYPATGSVFPPDFVPPTIEWRDADPRARLWVVDFVFGDGAAPVRAKSHGERLQLGPIDERCAKAGAVTPKLTPNQEAGHAWKPDAATWDKVKKHGVQQPVTMRFLGYEDDKAKNLVSSGQVTLRISSDPVGAPVFYRDVPLISVPVGEHGLIQPLPTEAVPLIAWRLMDLSTGRSRVMMSGLPTCANCHSFSHDGKWMGIDVDGLLQRSGKETLRVHEPDLARRAVPDYFHRTPRCAHEERGRAAVQRVLQRLRLRTGVLPDARHSLLVQQGDRQAAAAARRRRPRHGSDQRLLEPGRQVPCFFPRQGARSLSAGREGS
jgi:hypothetical protein